MNMEEALRMVKKEFGISEMPMDPQKRKDIASRVLQLCTSDHAAPRLSTLEEF